ncbi:MAG TPA: polysaccharide deacetylase family protein [Gemmatimonadaceae bacterium]
MAGHDPAVLRERLEYLRRRRYRLMDVGELLGHLDQGTAIDENAVVFTVDDGYADFHAVAAPVFAAYDCPVTVFLITDFVSGALWNWFDRIPWIIAHSTLDTVTLDVLGARLALKWSSAAERDSASEEIIERLKQVPDDVKERSILDLAVALEVSLPRGVPERDRGMTWDQVRDCAGRGVSFGAHTVTHPILSRVSAERSDREIGESWRRVVAETSAAVPVFCYPNGTPADFSAREKESVARAGMRGALSTVEASLPASSMGLKRADRFAIPRFSYPEDIGGFVQIVSGLEAMRGRVSR